MPSSIENNTEAIWSYVEKCIALRRVFVQNYLYIILLEFDNIHDGLCIPVSVLKAIDVINMNDYSFYI